MDEPMKTVNLMRNFNGFRALDNLDIAVRRNSSLGFLGPNGAGKTTTIKVLTNPHSRFMQAGQRPSALV